jgi:hypothetical protein
MPIHPGMVEELAEGTLSPYREAQDRLLGIIARQLADGLDAPGWVERKFAAVQAVRRAAQGVVDELGKGRRASTSRSAGDPHRDRRRRARPRRIIPAVAGTPPFPALTRMTC